MKRARLILVASALALLGAIGPAACVQSSTVTQRSTLRTIPVAPESAWQDLLQVAEAGRADDAARLFSRRRLRQEFVGGQLVNYPSDPEKYDEALRKLDLELSSRATAIESFGAEVCEILQSLQDGGGAFLVDRELTGGPNYSYRRDDTSMPWGPNAAQVTVRYWRRGISDGEGVEIRLAIIQEYEEWKIDDVTPSFQRLAEMQNSDSNASESQG